MIESREELKEYIFADNAGQQRQNLKWKLISRYARYPQQRIRKFKYYLRMQEYYINTARGNKFKGLMGLYYERKKNRLGERLGIEIGPNCFGKGLQIYHSGIIVNTAVRAGENCRLHGGNCIGNNGKTEAVPRLGDNVDIGYGAVLIGDIRIADGCVIGANAVVNKTVEKKGSTVVGIPAKAVK
ncbi:MAG: serine acetyltransferase [Lachnospiraceae bacterium]|nr:serine acetyltransferase [Lachnospiraceae bacterium]